jgi:hypothetical protein
MAQIREFFWSMRLVEILPFAGLVAVARVSATKALFLGGWLAAFILFKATSARATVQDATFFRLLMPAWPAYLVLAAALPMLVPGVAARVKARIDRVAVAVPWRSRTVLASAAVIGVVPLLVVAALPTLRDRSIVSEFNNNVIVPVAGDFHLRAQRVGNRVIVRWQRPAGARGGVFYRVYRSSAAGQSPVGGLSDYANGIACRRSGSGASACQLLMDNVSVVRGTTFSEPASRWTEVFRVGLMANWRDDLTRGDVLVVSTPSTVPGKS